MSAESWLQEYDRCSQLGQNIMTKINERNKHARTSMPYTKLSAQIRISMKQFSGNIQTLRDGLIRAVTSYHVQREMESRQGMIDKLTTKEKQIEQAFNNEGSHARDPLMARGADRRDLWGVHEESNEYNEITNRDLRMQQQHIIIEQDRGLEVLSHVIARQKNMALDIGTEVESQNELLDDINDHTDRTNQRLIKDTRHIKIVDRKSATCCFWVFIILLFVAILVIILVPYQKKKIV